MNQRAAQRVRRDQNVPGVNNRVSASGQGRSKAIPEGASLALVFVV
jgi:hypothetical protein